MATPVFDGASEEEIKNLLTLSGLRPRAEPPERTDAPRAFERRPPGLHVHAELKHLVGRDKMTRASTGRTAWSPRSRWAGTAQFGGSDWRMARWASGLRRRVHAQEMTSTSSRDVKRSARRCTRRLTSKATRNESRK